MSTCIALLVGVPALVVVLGLAALGLAVALAVAALWALLDAMGVT